MLERLVVSLANLKQDFARSYSGSAHIQEVLPSSSSEEFPVDENHLQLLHGFAQKNPIYFNSFEEIISGVPCVVYEGDINEYWLNSIKHGSSCQPFYPTWIMSAYVMTSIAKALGYDDLIDIGSGDGRIAFCASLQGLHSYSIEIDEGLVDLQNSISRKTNQNFNPIHADALEFDYGSLDLGRPVFFIGGLAQMGGDILATNIIDKINSISDLRGKTGIVFAGTNSKRNLSGNLADGGWSDLIKRHDLKVMYTVSLPTVWTFDQQDDTPYIYTKFN
ncbi:MAG: class I SAM-dependent methyltransferase [Nitrosopumilus sp.]|nr:class I SAM-dependent methyltransferase [Nitrosopumilus sp.]